MAADPRWKARTGLLGLLLILALALWATPALAAPLIEVATPAPGATTGPEPVISGSTSDPFEDPVTIVIYSGETAGVNKLDELTADPAAGAWSTQIGNAQALGAGTYTAVAEETEAGEPAATASAPVTFTVDTSPPEVTIEAPAALSKQTEPTFSGTASEAGTVTVHIKDESGFSQTLSATTAGGAWVTAAASLPSGKHVFSAYATENSDLGNKPGESPPVDFEVNTEPPVVTLSKPASRSKNRSPAFSGTASENTLVTVDVYNAADELVATASGTASGGSWTAGSLSKQLATGKHVYTAIATEKSAIGNPDGHSSTVEFEVDTEPPALAVTPPARSRNTSPEFSGTASESGPVVVHVLEGGKLYATATATAAGGTWTSGALSKELPSGNHRFSVNATEVSALGNAEGTSPTVEFEVDTEAPVVSISQPPTPSKDQRPSFSGTASESGEVTVTVYQNGAQVAQVSTLAAGGKWSTGQVSPELPAGRNTFIAQATERSAIGNDSGISAPATFEVDTQPPALTLAQPPTPSRNTSPSFSGTTTEAGEVEVHVMEGNTPVAVASTKAAGGAWTATLAKALTSGGKHDYTAYATEASGLGNEPGTSSTVAFEIDTEPPSVTLTAPAPRTKERSPVFSGEAGEAGEVEVHVYEGKLQVATAKAPVSGGVWTSGALSAALATGKHKFKVLATEKSSLGNAEGKSEEYEFEVDTEPPTVTLTQPPLRSKNVNPTFSGTAEEAGEVVIRVSEATSGTEVASATATTSGGSWTSGAISKALPEGKGHFIVQASEKSALGNEPGESAKLEFEVDTEPPVVSIGQPLTPSNNQKPVFSGTASENTLVTVDVYSATKELVASASGTASGGTWTSGALSSELPKGKNKFTAIATEKSAIGNKDGNSSTVEFEVNTDSPTVTLNPPAARTNSTSPTFSGTASEAGQVEVVVLEGETKLASAIATVSGGSWTSGALSQALPAGKHALTVHATEPSALGNLPGKSATAAFELDTEKPIVTLSQPPAISKNRLPTFSGTANEATEVEVRVLENGAQVATAKAKPSNGTWTTGTLSEELPEGKHSFTAEAIEPSAIGNESGKSAQVSFEVDTEPPVVTLEALPLVSNNANPTLSGSAGEAGTVSVRIYAGSNTNTKPVFERSIQLAKAGNWEAHVTPGLESGHRYTAQATEPSALGNKPGESAKIPFEIDTGVPEVTVTQPPSPSKNTMPIFEGTVTAPEREKEPVTVYVYKGSSDTGPIAAELTATVSSNGTWSTQALTPALSSGKSTYTVLASTPSVLGNGIGESAPVNFVIDTEAPTVTLAQPPALSNDTTPTFGGTASEAGEVVVRVYSSSGAEVTPKLEAKVKAGTWEARETQPLKEGSYTASATEESAIGNGTGTSRTVSFKIDVSSPVVTLNPLPTPSPDRMPIFSGTAEESGEPVTVDVYRGSRAEGAPVASTTYEGTGGEWTAPRLLEAQKLEFGSEYTAVATQPSAIGNKPGSSKPFTFQVEQILPTVATEPATSVGRTSAAIYASVNPRGGPIGEDGCYFEYGPTTAYGTVVYCGFVDEAPAFPPAAASPIGVFARIYKLTPSTTYHVRIVAVGEGGVSYGADTTFTTLEPLVFPMTPKAPASTTTTTPKQSIGASGVQAFFAQQLIPGGGASRIGALLKHGAFRQTFKAPEAGSAVIDWYYQPPGGRAAGRGHSRRKPKPVLIASGKVLFRGAVSEVVDIRLTAQGRQALRGARRMRLSVTCTFTPSGAAPVSTSGTFSLHR